LRPAPDVWAGRLTRRAKAQVSRSLVGCRARRCRAAATGRPTRVALCRCAFGCPPSVVPVSAAERLRR
jgi:hypothetical protein